MSKDADRHTNNGKYEGDTEEDGTHAERMKKFDRLPKRVRRFLADAPFDFAVTSFYNGKQPSPYLPDDNYLNFQAKIYVETEVAQAYGYGHPQAKDAGVLVLTPRREKQRGRTHRTK